MSPERIAPEHFGLKNSRPTISSDCYALGMVIYETISGNVPFHKDTDLTVSMKVVMKGEHPPRGVKFTKTLWGMLERCWASKPNDRPSIESVLRCLEVDSSGQPSHGLGKGTDEDSDNSDSATGSSGGGTLDFFATDDHVQLSPTHSLRDHYLADQPKASARRGRGQQTTVDSTSDTSSDDILDGLVEDAGEGLNESGADEEVGIDKDFFEALDSKLAKRASDADDVRPTTLFRPSNPWTELIYRNLAMTPAIQMTNPSLKPPRV